MTNLIDQAANSIFNEVLKTNDATQLSENDSRGCNLYHFAAMYGRTDVAMHLFVSAPNLALDQKDHTLWTPMHYSIHYGHPGIAGWLRNNGAELNPAGTNAVPCEKLTPNGLQFPILGEKALRDHIPESENHRHATTL